MSLPDNIGRFLAALVLACTGLGASAAPAAHPGIADLHSAGPTPYRSGLGSVADSANFLPVGTGVSSARVGALIVRTDAGFWADVGLVVPVPKNEVQPRSYRITATGMATSKISTDDKKQGIPDFYAIGNSTMESRR